MVENKIKDIKLVAIKELVLNPKNRNKHPDTQIEALCKQFSYQGIRQPIVVSNRTGQVVAGHGRIIAAKKLKMPDLPVSYQDFDDEAQEWAYGIADNATQQQSLLDFEGINLDLPDFGTDFDIDLLGIENFVLDPSEINVSDFQEPASKNDPVLKDSYTQKCPNCGVLIEKVNG